MQSSEAALSDLGQAKPGDLRHLYLIFGEETYTQGRLLALIRRLALDPSTEAWNYTFADQEAATLANVRAAVLTPPVMSARRLVVARNPAELAASPKEPGPGAGDGDEGGEAEAGVAPRADAPVAPRADAPDSGPAETPRRAAAEAQRPGPAEAAKNWAALLPQVPPETCLVLALGWDLAPTNALLRAATELEPQAAVIRCLPATAKSAEVWVRNITEAHGGTISREAAQALVLRSGTDLSILEREIEKLIVYVGGREIEAADVAEAATPSAEASVFELVDHLGSRRPYQAVTKLRRLLEQGEPPLRLMAMVTRQVRLIFITKELLDSGGSVKTIEDRLKLPTWVVRGYLAQARNHSRKELSAMMRSLSRLDLDVKTGRQDAATGLELFILAQAGGL